MDKGKWEEMIENPPEQLTEVTHCTEKWGRGQEGLGRERVDEFMFIRPSQV